MLIAIGAAAVSVWFPISYDEAHWLSIGRMIETGSVLYETAIDNKSPVVYLVVSALDHLPGPFPIARALMVGILAFSLWHMLHDLTGGGAGSTDPSRGLWLATFLLLASFQLQTELLAAPLILLSIGKARGGSPGVAGTTAVAATCITPLAAPAIPVSLWTAYQTSDRQSWTRATLAVSSLTVAILIAILVVPSFRYGLVELNVASRLSLGSERWDSPAGRLALTLSSVLPLFFLARGRQWTRAALVGAIAMTIPAAMAMLAFPHYWIVPAAGVAAFSRLMAAGTNRSFAHAAIALIPLAVFTAVTASSSAQTAARYDAVAATLTRLPETQWSYLHLDLQPYLTMHLPDRNQLDGPSINYLLWDTSRTSEQRAELEVDILDVEVLVDPGLSQGAEPIRELEPLLAIVEPHLDEFSCRIDVEGVAILIRPSLCSSVLESHR